MLSIGFFVVMLQGDQARDKTKRGEAKVARGCAEIENANPSSEIVHTIPPTLLGGFWCRIMAAVFNRYARI
jgi:hypothetical protein